MKTQQDQTSTVTIHFVQGGKQFSVAPEKIIRLQAKGNYSVVHFTNHRPVLMAKVLRQYERMLQPFGFIRAHKSHLVNSQHIASYQHAKEIHMSDNSIAQVSRRKKCAVAGMLEQGQLMRICFFLMISFNSILSIAQNVGIGENNPLSKLHVQGAIRSDSLLIEHESSDEAVLSLQIKDVVTFAENRHSIGVIQDEGPLWQSFTSTQTDTLEYVSMFFASSSVADSLLVYEGLGIEGTLLAYVSLGGGSGWVQSSQLNLPLTADGVYTFWIDNARYIHVSLDTYPGGSLFVLGTYYPNASSMFSAFREESSHKPVIVEGASNSTDEFPSPYNNVLLDLKGMLEVDELKVRGYAQDGWLLTSDIHGRASWLPATWKREGDRCYLIDALGKVGIGTNQPLASLHVGGGEANVQIGEWGLQGPPSLMHLHGDGDIYFRGSNGNTRFRIDAEGNASFGSDPNPNYRLIVPGRLLTDSIRITNGAINGYVLTTDDYGNASWMPNGASYWSLNGSHIYKNQSGNVGIGISDPYAPLHVASNANLPLAIFNGDTTASRRIEIQRGGSNMSLGLNGGLSYIGPHNNNIPFSILMAGVHRVYVSTSGNVGIGTSNPQQKLHVAGGGLFDGYVGGMWGLGIGISNPIFPLHVASNVALPLAVFQGDNSSNRIIEIQQGTNAMSMGFNWGLSYVGPHNNNLPFAIITSGLIRMHVSATGNVGIGSNNPIAKLHITKNIPSGGASDFILLENTVAGGAGIRYKNSVVSAYLWQSYIESDGKFKIGRDALDDFLTILPDNGNTGIGTNTPSTTLDVDGGIKTKYSGTIVPASFSSTGFHTVNLPIPELPEGWDFTNTVVLVTNSDGSAVLTIHQAKLTETTNIQLWCTVHELNIWGSVRFNYVIFKL